MSRVRAELESAGRLGFVAIMFSAIAFSQVQAGSPPAPKDIFSSIHTDLTEAADRTLAATLADQAWMNVPDPTTTRRRGSLTIDETSILKLRAAIDRVNKLKPTLESILRSEGVPVELSAVVLVESGGMTAALSPKGARGVWQFMPGTARRYGLVVDETRDERIDLIKSTHAAARYLRDLYAKFGDWSLALAAYNAGEVAVSNAIRRVPSRDFESVRDSGRLPLETRRYVPAISAAMNRLHYASSWLDPRESKGKHVVYASSGSGE